MLPCGGWLNGTPIAVIEGGQIYLVRVDHIGRPVFATTLAGTKVWEVAYLPFGGVHQVTGAPMSARFPGQWFQTEWGLHQNWMRDYDPTTGRYIEADPLGLIAGPSVYGYANQSPLLYYDPRGENPALIGILAGAAVAVMVDVLWQMYDNGGRVECVNWWQTAFSGVLGGVSGGYGGPLGGAGLKTWLKGLSKSTKGKIGEGLTRLTNPRLWLKSGSGVSAGEELTTVTDFTYKIGDVLYVVESKFGNSTLTRAQRIAQRMLGDRYIVSRWSYGFFEDVGGAAGGAVSGAFSPFFSNAGQGDLCCEILE